MQVISNRSFIAASVLLIFVFSAGCGRTDTSSGALGEIEEEGELRAGVAVAPPFTDRKSGGEYEGLDIDVLERLAKDIGVDLTLVPSNFDTVVAGLSAGKFDITPALCVTEERDAVIDFTKAVVTVGEVFVVKEESPYRTVEDLNKPSVTIPVSTGALGEQIAEQYTPDAGIKSIPGGTEGQEIQELLSGRADAYVTETPFLVNRLTEAYPGELRFLPDDDKGLESCPVAFGIPEGDKDFQKYINDFLEELQRTGEYDELIDKWSATSVED